MAKTFDNVNEVKTTREEGRKIVFNMAAALAALKATPMKAGRTGGASESGALKQCILDCIDAAKNDSTTQIGMSQIKAMLGSAGYDLADKKVMKLVSDTVWGISDRNKNCKQPVLKGVSTGVYDIL